MINKPDLDAIKTLNLKKPYVWLATWGGAGFLRPAPGTWGSATSIPVGLIVYSLWAAPGMIIGILLITLAGYWSAALFDQSTGGHDNKMIVIDEAAGQWIALLAAIHFMGLHIITVTLSFLLFRLFDILKPWPISYIDRHMSGASGVMADDILAGLIAALCLIGIDYSGILDMVI